MLIIVKLFNIREIVIRFQLKQLPLTCVFFSFHYMEIWIYSEKLIKSVCILTVWTNEIILMVTRLLNIFFIYF